MLNTLEKHKMVTKTENNRYRLGYRLATIGSIVTSRMEITGIAHPYLVDLSARTKETTHQAVMEPGKPSLLFAMKPRLRVILRIRSSAR